MIKINLLPPEDRKKTHRIKLPTFSGGGPKALWMIAGLVVYAGMVIAIASLQIEVGDGPRGEDHEGQAGIGGARAPAREDPQAHEGEGRGGPEARASSRRSTARDTSGCSYLNDISEKMPPNSWLTSVKENGGTEVILDGVTFSNYLIADLMTNLDKSDHFDLVSLNIAQEGRILEHKVIQFTLSSRITP